MKHLFEIILFYCCLAILMFAMVGCNANKPPLDIEVIELDGCQYVVSFRGSHSNWGTHKGNCKNPIHHVVDTLNIN